VQELGPSPAQRLSDKQTLKRIDDLFKDDEKAQMVLTSWQEGYDHLTYVSFGASLKTSTTPLFAKSADVYVLPL
jgi:hypothetical protein